VYAGLFLDAHEKRPPTFASGGSEGWRADLSLASNLQECHRPIGAASDGETWRSAASRLEPGEDAPQQFCPVARRFAFYLRYNLFLFKISRYRGGCSRPSTQEFAAAMNDHVTSAAPAPAPPKSRRFWNWKLIGGEIILTVLGVYLFVAQVPRLSGMAGLVVRVLGIWLLLSEFRGFAVARKAISFPSRFAKLPILSLRRMSVSLRVFGS
jgi:hypothetical protein